MRSSVLLLVAVLSLGGCTDPAPKEVLSGSAMGTTWTLTLRGGQKVAPARQAAVEGRLEEWEQALSRWRADSALMRFNASRSTDWQDVDVRLAKAVALAQRIAAKTEGALDITIAPLVRLWGFDSKGPPTVLPTEAEIAAAKADCGWRKVEVTVDPPRLRKEHPDLSLNVDAVAEGLAVDDLAGMLKALGDDDFLINLGGEVLACGGPWAAGIQMPDAAPGETFTTLQLQDEALATSGVYRQRFQRGGQSFSHVLDPKTGKPVTHTVASASVVAKTCAEADAWATALLVMGKEAGQPVAESQGLEVVWIGETTAVRK